MPIHTDTLTHADLSMKPSERVVRVHVETSVEIDLDAWQEQFGRFVTKDPDAIQTYVQTGVRSHAEQAIIGLLAGMGVLAVTAADIKDAGLPNDELPGDRL